MTEAQLPWFRHFFSMRRGVAVALVAVILIFAVRTYTLGRSRVASGIAIGEVELSGLSWLEARRQIELYVSVRGQRPVALSGDRGICAATMDGMGARVDPEKSLSALRQLATTRKGFSGLLSASVAFAPALSFDEAKLQQWITVCEAQAIANLPAEGRITAKDGDFVIHASRAGRKIDRQQMARVLGEAISRVDDTAATLPLIDQPELPTRAALERAKASARELTSKGSVLRAAPTQARLTMLRADLSKMLEWRVEPADGELVWQLSRSAFDQWLAGRRHRVEQRARDATYEVKERDRLAVVEERRGSRIALDQLFSSVEQGLRAGQRQIEIPLEQTELPKRVVADLEPLNIHEPVGSFTTRHACCQPRVNNIHRIADLVNGMIVPPGETFSLNELVGQRSLENGFVPAPSIEDGEMVDTIGGGVSQFATTFYNAVMRAGYEVLERQPHTYWFDRYPMGHEATLSWPKPDVVIRNDTKSGLLILTSYTERSITIRLFGDREGRRVDVSVSPRFDIVRPAVEFLPNSEVEPDDEKVKEGGCIGWSVWTMRSVTLKDGTTKKDKRKVIYKPRTRRVEVHPCKIPKDEPGYTGEKCPEPKPESESEIDGAAPAPVGVH
ncbi:MAG: VanW family protein [Myxococcales bacterium]